MLFKFTVSLTLNAFKLRFKFLIIFKKIKNKRFFKR